MAAAVRQILEESHVGDLLPVPGLLWYCAPQQRPGMHKWTKRALWTVLILVLLAYLGLGVWIRTNETQLIFHRELPFISPPPSLVLNQERVEFSQVDGTRLFAWIVQPLPPDHSDVWVLFFHGSEGCVSLRGNDYDDFRSLGFNVMAPEYPGYEGSPGSPSEVIIEREAGVAYDYLRQVKNVPAKNIVVYGVSLGSAVAVDLASRIQAGALIIQAGFTSVLAMGQKEYPFLPLRWLLKNRFESDRKISKVRMPVLVIHSSDYDRFHPIEHGQRLYDLAPGPKQLLVIRGRHGVDAASATVNPNLFPDIATFLDEQAGFQVRRPLPSIAPVFLATMESKGMDAAITEYHSLRREAAKRYKFREAELDRLGNELFRKERVDEAIAVLRFNAEQFAESFNAFDSLGDAYAAAGKDAEAIQNYQRSLTLFPDKENYSRPKLEKLEQRFKLR